MYATRTCLLFQLYATNCQNIYKFKFYKDLQLYAYCCLQFSSVLPVNKFGRINCIIVCAKGGVLLSYLCMYPLIEWQICAIPCWFIYWYLSYLADLCYPIWQIWLSYLCYPLADLAALWLSYLPVLMPSLCVTVSGLLLLPSHSLGGWVVGNYTTYDEHYRWSVVGHCVRMPSEVVGCFHLFMIYCLNHSYGTKSTC